MSATAKYQASNHRQFKLKLIKVVPDILAEHGGTMTQRALIDACHASGQFSTQSSSKEDFHTRVLVRLNEMRQDGLIKRTRGKQTLIHLP